MVLSSASTANTFYFKSATENKWLQHSNGGGGIRFFTDNNNATNCSITIEPVSSYTLSRDPYDLDGKTFGMAYNNNSALAAAMMAEAKTVSSANRLAGQNLLIRPDVLDHDGNLLVAEDTDISEWTFESVSEDKYYIKTTVSGSTKYLTINGANVTLEDAPDATYSVVTATPGTGGNSGKWHFTVNGYSLNLFSNADNGFGAATGTGATTWLNLVEKTLLDDSDFTLYSAHKVRVSDDDNVYDKEVEENGQTVRKQSQVVIYTRIWNTTDKKYEFYAVDHDGKLFRVYESGDVIQWYGTQVNTALWDFTEYHNSDGSLNYYYELENAQYHKYLAPQVTGGTVLADGMVGINLPGRRDGADYSPIIAWDDDNYSYVGLKADLASGRVVPCSLEEAEDFYFAVASVTVQDDAGIDQLSTIATVNNNDYGITMRMIDFNNPIQGGRDSVQNPFFGGDNDKAGLLSNKLDEGTGYPTTTSVTNNAGHSLGELFDSMTPVNHLFIQSVYNESGYFQYDSTQNFAHLNADGTFTVFDQLAAIGTTNSPTRTHGQFMPYNDISPGLYASVTNQTDVLKNTLPDTDPRKGEKLYLIPEKDADYYFGMEMSASFTQTPNGKDAWGHDIIFEFSGDDDFWLYVDGELILDLGGVHSAMTGSVNFRTGEVKSSRGNSTLYELFKKNYKARNPSATEDDVNTYLNGIFKRSEENNGWWVFKDYTKHTMKIFYMERGAGASNLKMRFNLASVKPGTVMLSKVLSGAESQSNNLAEFPFQVRYLKKVYDENGFPLYENGDSNKPLTTEHILTPQDENFKVYYANTKTNVRFEDSFSTPDGVHYDNVFILKAGQTAEINFPDSTLSYAIVECGVNTDVYDWVKVNDGDIELKQGTRKINVQSDTPSYHENPIVIETEGTYSGTARKDFGIDYALVDDRQEVTYANHVPETALRTLSFTKKLYDTDGETLLSYPANSTTFDFRLYLGSENDASPPLANMYSYQVKDPSGNYCRWDASTKKFVSLGKTVYNNLTAAEKSAATFTTSIYGSISKIPAGYTVEVRDLLVTTKYKVEERPWEMTTITTTSDYDGKYFWIEVTADVVQTHNAGEAIRSAWGVDPAILGVQGGGGQ